MATEIKVNRQNLIAKLASLKEDNIGIAGIAINRNKFLQALKLQTQDGADILTLRYGKVSYQDTNYFHNTPIGNYEVDNEPCVEVSCNHTVMRFLNRPKYKGDIESAKIKHLGFITEPEKLNTHGIAFNPVDLLNALTFVTPCMASDDTRPILRSILFDSGNDTLKLVSADGFRLATFKLNAIGIPEYQYVINNYTGNITNLIAYLKALKPQGKGKSKTYPQVYMTYSENAMRFRSINGDLELERFNGTFPDYTQLIPQTGTTVEFIAESMLQAVNALSPVTKDGSGIIKLIFQKYDVAGKVTLSAHSEDIGETSVECDAIVESDCKIAINSAYLKDLLNHVRETKVTAMITSPSNPIVFESGDWQCVVMPMFVSW